MKWRDLMNIKETKFEVEKFCPIHARKVGRASNTTVFC